MGFFINPDLNTVDYTQHLIKTKLYAPQPKPNLVARPRLVNHLNKGHDRKLIFLQAPAGYGKTTAVVEWLSQSDFQVAWYSIDSSDNDINRFLSYLAYGLGHLQDGICQSLLPLIYSSEPPPKDLLLAQLINDFGCLDRPTILVIDDYHLINKKEIHDAFLFIVQHLPQCLQIVVLSRAELPFSVSTLRVAGQFLDLNLLDLRFTRKETESFVNDVLKMGLSTEIIDQLDKRTDGWVSGLQLAAMSMRDHKDTFIQHLSGNDRFITSYLVDEVVTQVSDEINQFLLFTSILDRFCPALCNFMLKTDSSLEIIEQLEQSNAFIIPLDNHQTWYRYHHLFAELLQKRLLGQDRDSVKQLYKEASLWHEQEGHIDEAIDYAQKADDHCRVAELLNNTVKSIILHGGHERAIGWLTYLPAEMLRSQESLWIYLLLALLDRGAFLEAQAQLERLWADDHWTGKMSEAAKNKVRGYVNCFKAAINIHTGLNANEAKKLTGEAKKLMPDNEFLGMSIAYGHYGSACLHLGDITRAAGALDEAVGLSQKTGYDLIYLLWFSYRAQVELYAGNLSRAKSLFDLTAEYAATRGLNKSNVFINSIVGLGRIYYEWDELDEARSYLVEGAQFAEFGENIDRLVLAYDAYFRYLIAIKDFDKAREKLIKLKTITSIHLNPPVILARIEALEIELALASGDIESVKNKTLGALKRPGRGQGALYEKKWLALAKLFGSTGKIEHAVDILDDLIFVAEQQKRMYSVVGLKTILAIQLQKLPQPEKAVQNLKEALSSAESQNYLGVFSDSGAELEPLLNIIVDELKSKNRGTDYPSIEYLHRIIKSIESRSKNRPAFSKSGKSKKSTLTDREIQVIGLLAEGLSYIEIADQMNISINTLKTYIKHIYGKLEIHNKVGAINRAKDLKLI